MPRLIDIYCLLQLIEVERSSVWAVGSLSIPDVEGGQRFEGKEGEGALLRMLWICQPTHNRTLSSWDEGSIERGGAIHARLCLTFIHF